MKRIFKYPLEIEDVQIVTMPRAAKLLTAQVQGGICVLWALVETNNVFVSRKIRIFGTGHPADAASAETYVATCQDGLGLVWHVFDGGEGA